MTIQKTLSAIAVVLLLIVIMPNLLFSQIVQVSKVLDGNLLQLQNGKIVRLSGIYVPGTYDNNKILSQIAGDIKEFSQKYFSNRYFKMKYDRTLDDSTMLVCLYREYTMGEDEDVAKIFLKNGYAVCIDTSDLAKQYNYAGYQKEAQDSKTGLWSLVPSDYFKNGHPSTSYNVNDIKYDGYLTAPQITERKNQLKNGGFVRQPVLKDPTLAGVLSFIVPGAGQFYDEDFLGGFLYLLADGFCYYNYFSSLHVEDGKVKSEVGYLLAGAAVHILSIVEASKNAKAYNDEVYFSLNKVKDNYYLSLRLPLNF